MAKTSAQRTLSQAAACPVNVYGWEKFNWGSIFSIFGTLWLLAVPESENDDESEAILHHWRHQIEHDRALKVLEERDMFSTVAGKV